MKGRWQWTGPTTALAWCVAGLLSLGTLAAVSLPSTPTTVTTIRRPSTSTRATTTPTPIALAAAATSTPAPSSGSSSLSSTSSPPGVTASRPASAPPGPPSTPPDKTWHPPDARTAEQLVCARSWETNTHDPGAYTYDGPYDGAYQFLPGTWRRFAAQVEHLRASYGEHARWPENYAAMTANQAPAWVQDEVFRHGFGLSPGEWPSPNRHCRRYPYRPSGR